MNARWWGTFSIPEGSAGAWAIGPFGLWIQRLPDEWRLRTGPGPDPAATACSVRAPVAGAAVGDVSSPGLDVLRVPVHGRSDEVQVLPALPDRPVVERPQMPILLLPGEDVRMYVSTALWVRVLVGYPAREVCDVPTLRPSDTWFGKDTIHGELCYSGRTHARLSLEGVPHRGSRVLTAVRIENRALEPLPLDRMKLPVLGLSLFCDRDGFFWTEAVNVVREQDGSTRIDFQDRPPLETREPHLVAEPRMKGSRSLFARAFGGLLG